MSAENGPLFINDNITMLNIALSADFIEVKFIRGAHYGLHFTHVFDHKIVASFKDLRKSIDAFYRFGAVC